MSVLVLEPHLFAAARRGAASPVKASRPAGGPRIKLGLRARRARPRTDDFAGLERLDRPELDEDFDPPSKAPSRRRVA